MSNEIVIVAEKRSVQGKGASRRLRREESKVPAIVYGGNKEPQLLSIIAKDLKKALENEALYSSILTLKIDGETESVILKDLQRHPFRIDILHVDFMRVSQDQTINVHVPLHFVNEDNCKGVKLGGGMIERHMTEVEVTCLPRDLPEFIEVDVADLELGQLIHLSNLQVPAGVTLVALQQGGDHDLPVVGVSKTRGSGSSEEAESTEEGEESAE